MFVIKVGVIEDKK